MTTTPSNNVPRLRPHPADPNTVGQHTAGKIYMYRQSVFLFIEDMWGLKPQPVRPEYKEAWEEVKRASGGNFLRLKATVSPEWFGKIVGTDPTGYPIWHWYDGEGGFISERREFIHRKFISWQQVLILLSIEKSIGDKRISRHISVRSGHGVGKSSCMSWVILWFLFCFLQAQVPVTAPTANQMHDVLWKELAVWLARMPENVRPIYEWQHDYIRVQYDPEAWFARAKTSSKENTEALAGVHSEHVMIIADEASGIPEQVFNTAEGALTSGNVFVILIGNPTRTTGYFYDSHNRNTADWQTLAFSGEESPIVDRQYLERQAKRHKRGSNEYNIRVSGRFPSEDMMDDSGYLQLVPLSRIEVQQSLGVNDILVGRKKLSVDPSGDGDDECEFALRDNFRAKIIKTVQTTNPKEIAENIITFATRYNPKGEDIIIEGFGSGADAAKEVAVATKGKLDIYVLLPGNQPEYEEKINSSRFVRFASEMDDKNTDLFLNLRAVANFRMRNWLIGGGILLDPDPEHSEWAAQVASNKYKRGLQSGKIQMMPKKEQNKLRIKSPNKSDALALSFLLDREDTQKVNTHNDNSDEVDDRFDVL